MCFANTIVEAHRKLFVSPTGGGSLITGTHNRSYIERKEESVSNTVPKMSRTKSRIQVEICGDCGATDPSWASINRGILLCSDCCSIHRSLGRHISMVKSLRQGTWEPSVLNFVNSLNAHGANSVWEHHLLDTNSSKADKGVPRVRKPNPKDPLHPIKLDFIKSKHLNLVFALKSNLQEEGVISGINLENELSRQLHASVRTSNLETSLRLIVQGANPNFFHEEKRSTPLHVAAKFGQASQIELLIVYGADINAIDGNGLTPLEVAKANNHNIIAERLLDAMYEVTDRIIMFLGGKKPDHSSGGHLIIPETANTELSEQLTIARNRLQVVPNKMFEELVMDLYDEVDRRENEAIWATSMLNADNAAVPFLPANPFLSATRNQGRQKLARFSRKEFAGLLTDVLYDARRRQKIASLRPLDGPNINSFYNPALLTENELDLSDDEPIYDPVASDDDYAPVQPVAQQAIVHQTPDEPQHEVQNLLRQINDYKYVINQLKSTVEKLSSENSELKSKFSNVSLVCAINENVVHQDSLRTDTNGVENGHESLSPSEDVGSGSVPIDSNTSSSSSANSSNQSTIKRPASMYERRIAPPLFKPNVDCRTTTSMYQMAADKPFSEELKHRTDLVTRRVKELVSIMQDLPTNKDDLMPCGERVRTAVIELISIFTTPSNYNETIRDMLKTLTRYNILIPHECENLQKSYTLDDKSAIEKYNHEVRECAYYIVSAMKTLVMQFE
ncbi:ARF GTPase-activating protein GIT2 isoform X1 [Rhagoletis pomonella]|uniref:ARF GTPase-activating protein GIT2 isoform X1 n=2 Tax=Rhagoletis pomonella TaxID=28610 RepID=UPI001782CAB5|nr:ARF GTPase-activating protein GIT2 isoform X1 [Rhagoletis pomonella]